MSRHVGGDRVGEHQFRLAAAKGWPPACEMNDQVTASTSPRVASARLARRVRSWIGVSTGLSTPGWRVSGVTGTRSTPMIAHDLLDEIGLHRHVRTPGRHRRR